MDNQEFLSSLRDALQEGLSLEVLAKQEGLTVKILFEKDVVCEEFVMWGDLAEYLEREENR